MRVGHTHTHVCRTVPTVAGVLLLVAQVAEQVWDGMSVVEPRPSGRRVLLCLFPLAAVKLRRPVTTTRQQQFAARQFLLDSTTLSS